MKKADLLAEGVALVDDFIDWCIRVHGTVCEDGKITWDDLGKLDGASGHAIRMRCERRLQSRTPEDENRSGPPEWKRRDERAAKQFIRENPDAVAREVVNDPKLRGAVTHALYGEKAEKAIQQAKAKLEDPEVVIHRDLVEAAYLLHEVARLVKQTGAPISDGDHIILEKIIQRAEMINGSFKFSDDDLQSWLEEVPR